ncbi:hypothetical protein KL928_002713 [Ogataea angusta]|uniref:N-acetyltransferase domain-containing protein n=1 Tax=Pichia angusta TaxID=870730 RepID=A0AAN6DGH7_PICAN|nr:uncharacterized protein KL928_002713 [Ogataea angusta]KAG7818845.1 hypothetical protein KL928_002713 [Ogataea angusta]KAG7834591.1 hypothetical protein KL943_002975 [Ogataea angusta]KAG7848101.1 hypothetical protein KL941_002280 [Ogataea angusta]
MSFFSKLQSSIKKGDVSQANSSDEEISDTVSAHNLHVEVVTLKDYKKAAKTLQIAFKDDLYVNYLTSGITDARLKRQMNMALFEATVYSTILKGLVVAVRDSELEQKMPDAPFLAVACFEKPQKAKDHQPQSILNYLWSLYQGGYLKFMWLANKETRQRVFEEQSQMLESFRAEVLGPDRDKSWYLSDIGAIPRGRGKGLARRLIDFVTHNYIDLHKQPTEDGDSDLEDDADPVHSGFDANEESLLDSEIQSYNFDFDLQSDTFTDYSGYSSASSDASSAHSSWYYDEDRDILAEYDQRKSKGRQIGAPLYLESSHPRNRKIYQKLGFTYVKTVKVADVLDREGKMRTLTLDLMVRGIKGAKWQRQDST